MPLASGTRVGPYEIVTALGAGGMGEVYRARDTRLGRDVALKVLPADVAHDSDRRARFEREARAVAALSHPNILALHDVGTEGDTLFVVTELLEGETLADRLRGGALPVRKAVEIALAVARGLAAAHGKGITHRDLKPANIFVLADGQVKLLDFGLAREIVSETGPTHTNAALTDPGTVLGTAGYMAPEQVRGQVADGRADLFALGVVLYELLTGRRAFARETTAETLTAILKEDPPELTVVRADVTPALERIVRHALEKNPAERFQTARDVIFALEAIADAPTGDFFRDRRLRRERLLHLGLPLTAGVVLGAISIAIALRSTSASSSPVSAVTRTTLMLTHAVELGTERPALAIAPDGSRIAYIGDLDGRRRLFVRRMDTFDATAMTGTEGASGPFFSSDGEWIGYIDDWELKKIPAGGGAPVSVSGLTPMTRGVGWIAGEEFVHNGSVNGPLDRVLSGSIVSELTTLVSERGEQSHRWPVVLPGGQSVLYTIGTGQDFSTARIAAVRLDTRATKVLVEGGTSPQYAASGHLLFVRGGTLMAVPFDADRLEITGDPVAVVEGIAVDEGGAADYAVSRSGTLVYVKGAMWSARRSLVWVDRAGVETTLAAPTRAYMKPTLSPLGTDIAVSIPEGSASDIWFYNVSRRTLSRFTSDPGEDECPVWDPDGEHLTWCSEMHGTAPQLHRGRVDRSAPPQRLLTSEGSTGDFPASYTADGLMVAFSRFRFDESRKRFYCCDLFGLARGGVAAELLLSDSFLKHTPVLSPDGAWMAYVSEESGREEVFLRRRNGPPQTVQLSREGGTEPSWSRTGGELFYRNGHQMLRVPISTSPTLEVGTPQVLFERRYASVPRARNYDVDGPGLRFLMIRDEGELAADRIHVVTNWLQELRARVPTR